MPALVVIPTYQEAENVADVLARVRTSVPDAHILVVDDGSPDGTADLAQAKADELGQIDVLRRAAKSGLGPSYRAGFAWGLERGHDVLIEMDADLSHDPAVLPQLIEAVTTGGADLAIGLDQVRADGYGFQIEMAYEVSKAGGTIVEIPIEFRDRLRGESKMSPNIVGEALWLVTRWGVRDRTRRLRRHR